MLVMRKRAMAPLDKSLIRIRIFVFLNKCTLHSIQCDPSIDMAYFFWS